MPGTRASFQSGRSDPGSRFYYLALLFTVASGIHLLVTKSNLKEGFNHYIHNFYLFSQAAFPKVCSGNPDIPKC